MQWLLEKMSAYNTSPTEPDFDSLESKDPALLAHTLHWVNSLPEDLLQRAECHPSFEYAPADEQEEHDMQLGGNVPIPMGPWNAILHLATEAGLYPDPQMLEIFCPLGRQNTFYFLDLPTINIAFPGNGDLIVEGLNYWLNNQERWSANLSEWPSVIRKGQSVYTYFLNAVFELAPLVVRNRDLLRAAARIATIEGRTHEFVVVFESLLAEIYLPKNSIA